MPHDKRFDAAERQQRPSNLIYQRFLLTQQWSYNATNDIDGMSRRNERVVSFIGRQVLGMMPPSNRLWTNPEVIAQTVRDGGADLLRGGQNLVEDLDHTVSGPPGRTEDYPPARDVAVPPGKVVFLSLIHISEPTRPY